MVRNLLLQNRTTVMDRFLLMITIAILPLQSHAPKIGGISILFIVFSSLAGYLVLWRPRILGRTWRHPVFLTGYALVAIGLSMEAIYDSSMYYEVFRIGLMVLGAVFVASLCRDRRALLSGMYGFLLAGIWLSLFLFLTTFGVLSSAKKASNFQEASRLRQNALAESSFEIDPNTIAFHIAQGAVVAVALALTAKSTRQRYTFLVIGAFCLIAAFLPMSRGGLIILVASCTAVVHAYGVMKPRVILAVGVLFIAILVWVPEAVFSRLTFSSDKVHGEHVDGRTRVYTAAIEHLSEYVLTGVGIKHFYGEWGRHTRFFKDDHVSSTHNSYVQVTVYWGLAGLLTLLALVWQSYRCLPKRCGADPLRLCLLGIAVSVLMQSMVLHLLHGKEFSIALGMIAGSSLWIWPRRIIFRVRRLRMGDTSLDAMGPVVQCIPPLNQS